MLYICGQFTSTGRSFPLSVLQFQVTCVAAFALDLSKSNVCALGMLTLSWIIISCLVLQVILAVCRLPPEPMPDEEVAPQRQSKTYGKVFGIRIPKTKWTRAGVIAYGIELTIIMTGIAMACQYGQYASICAGIAAVPAIYFARVSNST